MRPINNLTARQPVRRDLVDDYSLEITSRDAAGLSGLGLRPGTPVSITFLPRDSLEGLVRAAVAVREAGAVPIPHVAARRLPSAAALQRFIVDLVAEAAVDQLFVIGGDPLRSLGPFNDALAVLQSGVLGDFGIRKVGIAGYPDGHPQVAPDVLERALHAKLVVLEQQGCAAEIVTQFVFDADTVLAWLGELRAQGVAAPVRVGVPGPASAQSLLKFAARCGVGASTKVLAKYGLSVTRLLATAAPDRLIDGLTGRLDPQAHGPVKAHLYPFGGLQGTLAWANARTRHAIPQTSQVAEHP